MNRAKWVGRDSIRLRFDPFAYRYIRLKVLARDGYTCYWCSRAGNTMDHVIPWSKGGRTTMNNCICACEECNGLRGDMPAEEFARLRGVAPPRPEGIPVSLPRPVPMLGSVAIAPAPAPDRRPELVELRNAGAVTRLLIACAWPTRLT